VAGCQSQGGLQVNVVAIAPVRNVTKQISDDPKSVFLVAYVRPHHARQLAKSDESNLCPRRSFVVGDAFVSGFVWWRLVVLIIPNPPQSVGFDHLDWSFGRFSAVA